MDDDEQLLKAFVINNKNLELLESKLNEFNPFRVLNIESGEIKHSNVLAWLLDPSGNRKLGSRILKKFLMGVINRTGNDDFNIMEVENYSYSDINVLRERNNIDILIESQKNNFVVVIENKIYSEEHDNQLKRYKQIVKEKFPNKKILLVYLTLEGESPSEDSYATFSYEDVYDLIKNTLELEKINMNTQVVNFINHYLRILEVILMADEKIVELCKNIYKKHKRAIELINDNISGSFELSIDEFKNKNKIVELKKGKSIFWFLPKNIEPYLPKKVANNWHLDYPLSLYFERRKNDSKLKIAIQAGPLKNSQLRIKFLRFLKDNNYFPIKSSSLKENSTFTDIFSKTTDFEDWENEEQLTKQLNKLYSLDSTKKAIDKLSKAVKEFDWAIE